MSERTPNLLIFMTDQQQGGTVLPGHPLKAQTPVLDRFRAQSVTFARTFCPSPHCCPSRASFFTGLYPSEHGVWHNVNVTNAISRGLNPGVQPWSVDLAAAGYRLALSGKWHVSNEDQADRYGWEIVYPAGTTSPPRT
ncbi:MAG: sulfatase-like hydrolase/transferase, partial [Planctomycetota bacterium]